MNLENLKLNLVNILKQYIIKQYHFNHAKELFKDNKSSLNNIYLILEIKYSLYMLILITSTYVDNYI